MYRLPSQNEKYFIEHLSKTLGQLSCQYDKTMLIGDFNLTINNKRLQNVTTTFDLECLIKKQSCFQSSNPTSIDLILTSKKEFVKNTDVIEAGISNNHSLTVTALKSVLLKGNAKTKLYWDCDSFIIDHFKEDLDNNLKNNSITEYSHFQNVFLEILHKHAPIKKKILRFNNNPFMAKPLKSYNAQIKIKKIFSMKQDLRKIATTK